MRSRLDVPRIIPVGTFLVSFDGRGLDLDHRHDTDELKMKMKMEWERRESEAGLPCRGLIVKLNVVQQLQLSR